MDDKRLELRISSDMLRQIDLVRGGAARATWVKQSVWDALAKAGAVAGSSQGRISASVASSVSPYAGSISPHAGNSDALPSPGCPECGANMARVDDRWSCGDCGWAGR